MSRTPSRFLALCLAYYLICFYQQSFSWAYPSWLNVLLFALQVIIFSSILVLFRYSRKLRPLFLFLAIFVLGRLLFSLQHQANSLENLKLHIASFASYLGIVISFIMAEFLLATAKICKLTPFGALRALFFARRQTLRLYFLMVLPGCLVLFSWIGSFPGSASQSYAASIAILSAFSMPLLIFSDIVIGNKQSFLGLSLRLLFLVFLVLGLAFSFESGSRTSSLISLACVVSFLLKRAFAVPKNTIFTIPLLAISAFSCIPLFFFVIQSFGEGLQVYDKLFFDYGQYDSRFLGFGDSRTGLLQIAFQNLSFQSLLIGVGFEPYYFSDIDLSRITVEGLFWQFSRQLGFLCSGFIAIMLLAGLFKMIKYRGPASEAQEFGKTMFIFHAVLVFASSFFFLSLGSGLFELVLLSVGFSSFLYSFLEFRSTPWLVKAHTR